MNSDWAIVAGFAVTAPFVFLVIHAFITVALEGRPYQFPVKVAWRGPKYCPHCGREIRPKE